MSTDATDPTPVDPEDGYDPEVSAGEAPQAMRLFHDDAEPDVHLDPDHPAFDRVQSDKRVDEAYERDGNRRFVKERGDHRHTGQSGDPDA